MVRGVRVRRDSGGLESSLFAMRSLGDRDVDGPDPDLQVAVPSSKASMIDCSSDRINQIRAGFDEGFAEQPAGSTM